MVENNTPQNNFAVNATSRSKTAYLIDVSDFASVTHFWSNIAIFKLNNHDNLIQNVSNLLSMICRNKLIFLYILFISYIRF